MECGVKVVVQNGRAIRRGRRGAPGSPWAALHEVAVVHPGGATGSPALPHEAHQPQGQEPGWVHLLGQALDTIVDNLREITAKYGGEAIACQAGTSVSGAYIQVF